MPRKLNYTEYQFQITINNACWKNYSAPIQELAERFEQEFEFFTKIRAYDRKETPGQHKALLRLWVHKEKERGLGARSHNEQIESPRPTGLIN